LHIKAQIPRTEYPIFGRHSKFLADNSYSQLIERKGY